MGLSLLVGPANAGKVGLLVDRYVQALDRDPVLVVPTRVDVDRVERRLLAGRSCLLGGFVGTWDDLFARLAGEAGGATASDVELELALRRAVAADPGSFGPSARSAGFADALREALGELEAALAPDGAVPALAGIRAAYRRELDALGLRDRHAVRRLAVERLERGEADAPAVVLAYGFDDLTGAEWALLEALSRRAEVTVSLPYEPGRPAFAWLERTAGDLARLAAGRVEEEPPRFAEVAQPAIAHVERRLFTDGEHPPAPPIEGAVRFFEGAGTRGALELVAEEVLALVRGGMAPERIGVVCPSLERLRGPLETALGTLGVPYAWEGRVRLPQTALGHALVALLRFAWAGGDRRDLFAFLRSPYSGLARSSVDYVEGRLRGRAVLEGPRVEEEAVAIRGGTIPSLDLVRAAASPLDALRALLPAMTRSAHGLDAPPARAAARDDLRAFDAARRVAGDLERWEAAAGPVGTDDVLAALARAPVRGDRPAEPGRVAVVDLARARTRHFDAVFVLGLEEGSLPRRGGGSPFIDDEARRAEGARFAPADAAVRDRYLFYTACSRATRRLYLVREAATDEGSPREASPFWEAVASLFPADDVARWTRRRPLSALTWPLETAPTERERLRALAALASDDGERAAARSLARANDWERRLERALGAFSRPTRLRHPAVLEQLRARRMFNVTELERFADCSSAWFLDRFVSPRAIDAEVDPRLRGSVAHTALNRFFTALPRELGAERVPAERVEDALRLMRRCLEQAVEGQRIEMTPMQRLELVEGLWRDLEQVVRDEAASGSPLVPRRFEVSFGSERSAPELQRGLELGPDVILSGKIDRIDADPFSARGIVQDYKAGKGAHSAREIERELRLQIPLYMLVLRDLVGMEPLGGVYRPLAGDRKARGLLREEAREDGVPGFARSDYLDEEAFWGQVDQARATAVTLAGRIKEGDVRHDPKHASCPAWCDLWTMCRVTRA